MENVIITAVDAILSYINARRDAIRSLLRAMVETESPSDDPQAVNRFVELLADHASPMASSVRRVPADGFGDHLVCEMATPGKEKTGRILVLGHSDTVWPMGTLRAMPYREAKGRAWGPGVLDMKAGLAFFFFAVQALRELDIPTRSGIVLQVNSDEEVGSTSSRPLTEENARQSSAVLVLEPGAGLDGRLKTARKGVGMFDIVVHGRASHAGVDFPAGASAVVELARQINVMAGFTRLQQGITVNPGVISGGTRSNVVAAEARAEVDIRVVKLADAPELEKKFGELKPFDERCRIEVTGGLNRPPMERTEGVVKLFELAQSLGKDLGVEVQESSTGGGSDGNFTGALGVPTLDGLGGVGEGAHAENESILLDRVADRTALIAKLLAGN